MTCPPTLTGGSNEGTFEQAAQDCTGQRASDPQSCSVRFDMLIELVVV